MMNRDGFTLVELMVALSILGILAGAFYGSFHTSHRAAQSGENQITINQIARRTLFRIGREVRSSFPMQVTFEDGETALTFVAEDLEDAQTGLSLDTLRFTATVNDPRSFSLPSFDVVEMYYYMDTDPKTPETGLLRSVGLVPGLVIDGASGEEQKVTNLSSQIVSFNCRYFDEEEEVWVDGWEKMDLLPAAVEITIGLLPDSAFIDSGDNIGTKVLIRNELKQLQFFTTVVNFPLRAVPEQRQESEGQGTEPSFGGISGVLLTAGGTPL